VIADDRVERRVLWTVAGAKGAFDVTDSNPQASSREVTCYLPAKGVVCEGRHSYARNS
jgi:hypothetical protein